ncbi:MarR family transcriptional regulator [Lachnospiraceae bacterium OttesenSCG-928-D06]|nr:MarR family transcriptional regulator [Lachnospiraceae bacterium OttesenSCG-928-D06]
MERDEVFDNVDSRHALFELFFVFQNSLQAAGDAFFDDVTCKQFFLLLCLRRFGDELPTVNQLAERMGSSHQNVKQMLNKLEQGGYIKLCKDKDDRRKLRIVPAKRLKQLQVKIEVKEHQFLRRLYEDVSIEETRVLLELLLRLKDNLENTKEECKDK